MPGVLHRRGFTPLPQATGKSTQSCTGTYNVKNGESSGRRMIRDPDPTDDGVDCALLARDEVVALATTAVPVTAAGSPPLQD
jgi:hypothetical protein